MEELKNLRIERDKINKRIRALELANETNLKKKKLEKILKIFKKAKKTTSWIKIFGKNKDYIEYVYIQSVTDLSIAHEECELAYSDEYETEFEFSYKYSIVVSGNNGTSIQVGHYPNIDINVSTYNADDLESKYKIVSHEEVEKFIQDNMKL